MNNTLKKIVIPLLFIVLIPAISYSVFEINSLNDTEEVIEGIYKNQLNVILNSVNQYSDLTVSYWVNELNSKFTEKAGRLEKVDVDELFQKNKPLLQVFVLTNRNEINGYSISRENNEKKSFFQKVIENNIKKIDRLYIYIKEDYRKIEPLESDINGKQFLAVLLSNGENETVVIMELDTSMFVEEILKQVIMEAAGEEFAITCNSSNDTHEFNFDETIENKPPEVTSPLWLIPNYELGIIIKGRTLSGLIAERTYTNLLLLLGMNIIIIAGVIFIYRIIHKEIKLAQIKSDFVSNVSHELRTPLALISMFSETLEMNRVPSDEKRKQYYSIISQESNRLSRIVNSILSFSKIESGKRTYNITEGDLNQVVQKVYDNYKFHLENKNFNFEFISEKDLPCVKLDSEAVSEALINLIDNAAKYSNDKKEIVVRTSKRFNKVGVEVSDKGIGISKEDQQKIFDKFFRVSTGLVHDTKGTGLGLTIVKHVVEAHNAEIEMHSELGKGSTFRILFNSVNS